MLMSFLFYSNRLNTAGNLVIILILVIQTCLFPLNKKNGNLRFLDSKFLTTDYGKPSFSGVYMHFETFLPTVYKFGMVYTMAHRCLKIYSDWTKHFEKSFFEKNRYALSFIDNCFIGFVDKLFIKLPHLKTVEKNMTFSWSNFLTN